MELEASKFKDYLIIPDVLDCMPEYVCDLVFPSGAKAILGNELAPEDVQHAPCKVHYPVDNDAFHAIVMIDADSQNRDGREGIHQRQWVVVNVPDNDLAKGDNLSPYVGPRPSPETGLHRCVIVVYRQSERMLQDIMRPYEAGSSRNFNLRDFAEKNKLGRPVAANFFQTKTDASVQDALTPGV